MFNFRGDAMFFYTIDSIEPKAPAEGVEMRIIHGNRMTMIFYKIEKGACVAEHSHPHEQMGTVLKGSLELKIGPEKKIVNPGEAYHIPSDVLHSGKSLEGPAEVLEVFTPQREDLA